MGINEEKEALRTRYRHERKERYLEHSFEFLATSTEFKNSQVIASYISYGDEPDTKALNAEIIKKGKLLLLPRMATTIFHGPHALPQLGRYRLVHCSDRFSTSCLKANHRWSLPWRGRRGGLSRFVRVT